MASKRLLRTTFTYWLLLSYIVAALIWWFISLNQQNKQMRDFKLSDLHFKIDSASHSNEYHQQFNKINTEYNRSHSKFIGEGSTFLILILIGAALVYRSIRRQLKLQQQQQNFMMAVTHELKTPIAVAKLSLETLQKHQLEPEKQKKLIQKTLDETARLNFLTNNILAVSQLESVSIPKYNEEIDLTALLKDCLNEFKNRHSERPIKETLADEADIKGDPLLLQMLINNLLENANKYSPKGLPIIIQLAKNHSVIELKIADEGVGIPDQEKKKIFDKFYRIGNENTRKTQGTGLGLYLCKRITKNHNADIEVIDNQPNGSIFVIRFKN
ncbi:MAG: two-component sensor histidine kinase [Bacteroidetes bacterium]|nr:two-component sensor histidine kinase [Bacteroidota bacterium]